MADDDLREFPGLALLVRVPEWHRSAACRGVGPDVFFPVRRSGQPNHGAEAKAICAQCPVLARCLDDSVQRSEAYGIAGGCGEADRRVFRRALSDRPHRSPEVQAGCDCGWCLNLTMLLARLDGDRSAVADSNGPGRRHGYRHSYAKGCRCDPCRWSATALGQVLARCGMDTGTWWIDARADKVRADRAAWAFIEAVVVGLMAVSPAAPGDLAVRRAVADRRELWSTTRGRAGSEPVRAVAA